MCKSIAYHWKLQHVHAVAHYWKLEQSPRHCSRHGQQITDQQLGPSRSEGRRAAALPVPGFGRLASRSHSGGRGPLGDDGDEVSYTLYWNIPGDGTMRRNCVH
jgi:hypothetical protein